MTHQTTYFDDPNLQAQLTAFLTDKAARIRRLEQGGMAYWAKKPETLSLKWRLQKGDPAVAFKADMDGLHALADAGVPVPEVVAEGPDFVVTRDSGPILSDLLVAQTGTVEERTRAMEAAGRELARMHGLGLSHGRPAAKDMCWDGSRLTFLDFERYCAQRNTMKGHMQDLIIFVHSCFAFAQAELPEIEAACAAYRAQDTKAVWDMAAAWCTKKWWLDPLTKPLQWGNREGAKEFKAIPMTLRAFGVGR